jgi:hypothetical protein
MLGIVAENVHNASDTNHKSGAEVKAGMASGAAGAGDYGIFHAFCEVTPGMNSGN